MDSLPAILVVGDQELYQKLTLPLQGLSKLIYAGSPADALNRAADVVAAVIDGKNSQVAHQLCSKLRSDAITANLPLIVRFHGMMPNVENLVDATIHAKDFEGLLNALRELVPELNEEGISMVPLVDHEDEEVSIFDDNSMTVIWRRPAAEPGAAGEWPPPPPEYDKESDLVDFALTYAGYQNSLLEVYEEPTRLSPAEFKLLIEATQKTEGKTERYLDLIQTAINEALMSKDLDRMKLLSSAKNSLFDKHQRLRNHLQASKKSALNRVATGQTAVSETPKEELPDSVLDTPTASAHSTPPLPLKAQEKNKVKKSQLTLAAEAKSRKQHSKQFKYQAPRRIQRGGVRWLWFSLAFGVLIISITWTLVLFSKRRHKARPTQTPTTNKNLPPKMVRVDLTQTAVGIVLHPQAVDKENDRISYRIQWMKNGSYIKNEKRARLPSKLYKEGDRIEAIVYPMDGYAYGQPMRSQPLVIGKNIRGKKGSGNPPR